jgi:hypothetical protein
MGKEEWLLTLYMVNKLDASRERRMLTTCDRLLLLGEMPGESKCLHRYIPVGILFVLGPAGLSAPLLGLLTSPERKPL